VYTRQESHESCLGLNQSCRGRRRWRRRRRRRRRRRNSNLKLLTRRLRAVEPHKSYQFQLIAEGFDSQHNDC
jgi:hypothetical protein